MHCEHDPSHVTKPKIVWHHAVSHKVRLAVRIVRAAPQQVILKCVRVCAVSIHTHGAQTQAIEMSQSLPELLVT